DKFAWRAPWRSPSHALLLESKPGAGGGVGENVACAGRTLGAIHHQLAGRRLLESSDRPCGYLAPLKVDDVQVRMRLEFRQSSVRDASVGQAKVVQAPKFGNVLRGSVGDAGIVQA